jgi:hypothetical protein
MKEKFFNIESSSRAFSSIFWRIILMNKYFILLVALISFLAIECLSFGQPAGGAGGGFGGGRGGLEGMDGGMMGGMGRGMRMGPRPSKAERLASVKELEKQIAELKAATEKAPEKDPNIATLNDTSLKKFMDIYTSESDVINTIQKTLAFLSGTSTGLGGTGGMGSGLTSEVISELITLAEQEKAAKVTSRLEALAKEAEASSNRGGGMMGGRRGTNYTPPEGGFKYND